MKSPMKQSNPPPLSVIVNVLSLLISFSAIPASATVSEKVDQELVPQTPDASVKCETCPCGNPCGQLPPPPLPPPPPPPPSPKTTCCTPQTPPPPRFIYVTGEPGELYHPYADSLDFYSTAERNVAKIWALLVGYVVLGLLAIW